MADLTKLTVNGETYTVKDANAVHGPETARIGQVLTVKLVDESTNKPTQWTTRDLDGSGITVATFDAYYRENRFVGWICNGYTASQLYRLLQGSPVIAHLHDQQIQEDCYLFCGIRSGGVVIFDSVAGDGGWTHNDQAYYFVDGDPANKTTGNELWLEY